MSDKSNWIKMTWAEEWLPSVLWLSTIAIGIVLVVTSLITADLVLGVIGMLFILPIGAFVGNVSSEVCHSRHFKRCPPDQQKFLNALYHVIWSIPGA